VKEVYSILKSRDILAYATVDRPLSRVYGEDQDGSVFEIAEVLAIYPCCV